MPIYEFECDTCKLEDKYLEEDSSAGIISIFLSVPDRDNPTACPGCGGSMHRITVPRRFTRRWLGKNSKYPILEGPTDFVYKRGEERKRKEAREKSRKHFSARIPKVA